MTSSRPMPAWAATSSTTESRTSSRKTPRYHHEWYNGQGYPLGLKGEEIPEEARIIAVADAFDAMSSNRVYRKSCTPEHIRRELEEGKGRQFDPEMAERFIRLWDEGRLDSIIESNADETEEIPEGPSALLREVVETFVSQSTVVDKSMLAEAPEGDTDVDSIARGMEQSGSYNGALEVEYRQFVSTSPTSNGGFPTPSSSS